MAFFINQQQATDSFNEIIDNLNDLAGDQATRGRGDANLKDQITRIKQKEQINGINRATTWIMSTTEWLQGANPRALVWGANPSDVSWSMPQRSVHTKNLLGTVLHVWPDQRRNTFYDEFRLTFNLQSGSIMPVFLADRPKLENGAPVVRGEYVPAGGLINFYDFMQLVDAPKLTTRTTGSNGKIIAPRANIVSIQYYSNIFPKLTLLGMFDSSGIRFNDSGNNPNQVNAWSADFVVYDTVPRLSNNKSSEQFNANLLRLWAQERIDKAKYPDRN